MGTIDAQDRQGPLRGHVVAVVDVDDGDDDDEQVWRTRIRMQMKRRTIRSTY